MENFNKFVSLQEATKTVTEQPNPTYMCVLLNTREVK